MRIRGCPKKERTTPALKRRKRRRNENEISENFSDAPRAIKSVLTMSGRLLHPPKWVTFAAAPVVSIALASVFLSGQEGSAPAYAVYGMSAYCLTILILPLPKRIQSAKAAVIRRINQTPLGERYMHDPAFRGSVGICLGMTVNFFHVIFRVAAGIRYMSVWFISMAVYYLVLGGLRAFLIVRYRRRSPALECRCYRLTAWLLFLLNLPMGGMILLTVITDSGFSYPGYIIYLSALYAFYAISVSVVQLVKFRRLGSPILSAARVLNLVSAMMSVLGLQTAMISRFSENGESYRKMMNAVTGGFVYGVVIVIAIYMLLHSRTLERKVSLAEPIRE